MLNNSLVVLLHYVQNGFMEIDERFVLFLPKHCRSPYKGFPQTRDESSQVTF